MLADPMVAVAAYCVLVGFIPSFCLNDTVRVVPRVLPYRQYSCHKKEKIGCNARGRNQYRRPNETRTFSRWVKLRVAYPTRYIPY
jgi:hypothetical protein